MRTVGIVAEYDPFHRGHAYQLAEAKRRSGADAAVVVMSTVFTQRGDPALLSPRLRAEAALRGGADLVAALPVLWAMRPAEQFAEAGVRLLRSLGVDALSFGAETDDLPLLAEIAALTEDTRLQPLLRERMAAGLPYPRALSEAAESLLPGAGALLALPNNTLAVCYLRALRRLGGGMEVFPVRREGGYHDTTPSVSGYASATAVRAAILNGCWSAVREAVPDDTPIRRAAAAGALHRPDALDPALIARLRTMTPEELAALPDRSEGIERRLPEAARQTTTREALLAACKTRRYPYARLSRLASAALLGITDADCALPPPDRALLLGFRRDAEALPGQLGRCFPLQAPRPRPDCRWLLLESRAWDLWALGAGLPSGLLYGEHVVTV